MYVCAAVNNLLERDDKLEGSRQPPLIRTCTSSNDLWWISKRFYKYWGHVGWDIAQETSSLQWEASLVPAAFLCPNPHPSLLQSIILWNPRLFFLSGLKPGFCLPSLTLWPARHPFIPCLPPFLSPFLQPIPPERAVSSSLSINLYFLFFPPLSPVLLCIFLQRNACLWFIHPVRPLGLLLSSL